MTLVTLLIIILIVILIGGLPNWGWHGQGYGPSSLVGVVLVVLLVLVLLGKV